MSGISRTAFVAMAATVFSVSPTYADEVIFNDLIVDGSQCVGLDCSNGESFFFDTIKLKENNLRILFQDTSTAASFPSNDWRIIINDSANGGDNYLGIEDADAGRIPFRVEAGAPSNSLLVDSQGDVGIRQANPVLDLHLKTSDSPGIRLEQDGSSGWSPQTWDVQGNEANFFVRDATNGSSLPFRIRPGAPTGSMAIESDGDIGLGTSIPQTRLHVVGGDGALRISDTDATDTDKSGFIVGTHFNSGEEEIMGMRMFGRETINDLRIGGGSGLYNTANLLRFYTARDNVTLQGTERLRIDEQGNVMIATTSINAGNVVEIGTDTTNGNGASLTAAGVWTNGSSRLNKINIKTLETRAAIEALRTLRPVTYNGMQDSAETYAGFIAEEVPDLVAMNNRKGIAAIEIAAVLTAVVREHQQVINRQHEMISKLETRLAALETQIASDAATSGEEQ